MFASTLVSVFPWSCHCHGAVCGRGCQIPRLGSAAPALATGRAAAARQAGGVGGSEASGVLVLLLVISSLPPPRLDSTMGPASPSRASSEADAHQVFILWDLGTD